MLSRYRTFDINAQVIGQSMLGFIHCVRREVIWPYLEKHALININPNQWYPVQTGLDVLSDLAATRTGDETMFDFVSIGMKIAQTSTVPVKFAIMSPEQILSAMDKLYQYAIHRGDVGYIHSELIGEGHVEMMLKVPYPDDLMYGAIYGMLHRFSKRWRFSILYDEDVPRREHGGDSTILHVNWVRRS